MLFDDNDYYDHIFGPDDNNNDFNFNFEDFISNPAINDNIDTTSDDTVPVIDSIPQNPLPPHKILIQLHIISKIIPN